MATFSFARSGGTVVINGVIDETPGEYSFSVDSLNNILVVKADDGTIKLEVHTLADTVTVNGEAFSGTAAQLKASLLTDVFTSSSSGGSGGGTILQSPDNTLWQVGVNDSGVLVTNQVSSGTPGTLHLFSPDNTEWNVTVNDSGALQTTAI